MTPHRSSVPEDRDEREGQGDAAMPWGARISESENVSRAAAHPGRDDGMIRCPSCGSEKTTVATSADRGRHTAIRRDNTGYRCFTCGYGWTVTIGDDHAPDVGRGG